LLGAAYRRGTNLSDAIIAHGADVRRAAMVALAEASALFRSPSAVVLHLPLTDHG